MKKDDTSSSSNDETEEMNIVTKSSWYAVEIFGKVFGGSDSSTSSRGRTDSDEKTIEMSQPPKSVQETIERIQRDNDTAYL